jgi:hypothetical protein
LPNSAPFECDPFAYAIEYYRTHHPRRVGEEGLSVLGTKFAGTREPQIRFVHETGRVQERVATSVPQPCLCKTVEISVGGRKQRITRRSVAALHPSEEIGELTHRMPRHRAQCGGDKDSAFA